MEEYYNKIKRFDSALNKAEELFGTFSDILFQIEGDSRTVSELSVIWDDYGSYLYQIKEQLQNAIVDLIESR